MSKLKQALFVLATVNMVMGQRGSFAGSRPIGYPEVSTSTTKPAGDTLGNRFGDGDSTPSTTTQRLPLEANGDRDLVDRLSKLPVDNQPFWFINWQALEAHRKNPQTYPQKPNDFAPLPLPTSNNFQGGSSSGNINTANTANNSVTNFSPKQFYSGTTGTGDVNVSEFMNIKNGQQGSSGANENSNSAFNDNANRVATSNQGQNVAMLHSKMPNENPNEFVNTNLQVQSHGQFASVGNDQSTTPRVSPILERKTRDPDAYSPIYRDTINARPTLVRNRFRDNKFEEQRPVVVPYTRLDRPLYYFK